jgi:hypothetical protein
MHLGRPTVVLALVVVVGIFAITVEIWAIVDAASRPRAEWDAAGASKALWITLIACFAVVCGLVGALVAGVYFASVRPRLILAAP